MKFSSKMEQCGLSPMRKFNGEAAEAQARGVKIYHLNIGQPDIRTPEVYYDALKSFRQPVLSYAPSGGVPRSSLSILPGIPPPMPSLPP